MMRRKGDKMSVCMLSSCKYWRGTGCEKVWWCIWKSQECCV